MKRKKRKEGKKKIFTIFEDYNSFPKYCQFSDFLKMTHKYVVFLPGLSLSHVISINYE